MKKALRGTMKFVLGINYFIIIAGLLISCSPPMYIPNAINSPQLSEKNELRLAGHMSMLSPGFEAQSAYAVSDNIGIMGNFSAGKKVFTSDTSNQHQRIFGEIGIGYFGEVSNLVRFGIYSGYGRGRSKALDNSRILLFPQRLEEEIYGVFNRFFLQAEIGFYKEYWDDRITRFEPSFMFRLSHVDFRKYESNFPSTDLQRQKSFVDFGATFRITNGILSYIIQPGLSLPIGFLTDNLRPSFTSYPLWLVTGVDISLKKRKKQVLD